MYKFWSNFDHFVRFLAILDRPQWIFYFLKRIQRGFRKPRILLLYYIGQYKKKSKRNADTDFSFWPYSLFWIIILHKSALTKNFVYRSFAYSRTSRVLLLAKTRRKIMYRLRSCKELRNRAPQIALNLVGSFKFSRYFFRLRVFYFG